MVCRECGKGQLKILGEGLLDDTFELECQNSYCMITYDMQKDSTIPIEYIYQNLSFSAESLNNCAWDYFYPTI